MDFIDYHTTVIMNDDFENGFTTIEGQLHSYAEDESRVEIGELTAFYLNVDYWWQRGEEIWDLFDQHDDLPVYYRALFEEDTFVFDENVIHSNILIINNLQIKPHFRVHKLGLAALYRTIQVCGRECSIIAIRPFPLHLTHSGKNDPKWFADMDMGRYSTDLPTALTKLKNYYAQLGFVSLAGTELMCLNRDLRQPTLKDIGYDGDVVMDLVNTWSLNHQENPNRHNEVYQ